MTLLLVIYIASVIFVGASLAKVIRREPYITGQEAVRFLLCSLFPVFNTFFALVLAWAMLEDVVVWRAK